MRRLHISSCGTVALAIAASLTAATAHAATTFGTVTGSFETSTNISTPTVFVQGDNPTGGASAAPATGVVTAISIRGTGTVTAGLVRDATVVGSTPVTGGATTADVGTAATRISVQPGDRLAVGLGQPGAAGQLLVTQSVAAPITFFPTAFPASGSLGQSAGTGFGQLAIAATLEPDADGDGYGDETQDSCPTLANKHEGVCATQLLVTGDAAPSVVAGSAALVTGAVRVPSEDAPVINGRVSVAVPSGLELLALTAAGADCAGTVCTFGKLDAGTTRKVYAVVRPTQVGTFTIGLQGATDSPLLTPAGAASSIVLIATAAPITTGPIAPTPAAVKLCTVPKLKGLTKATATQKLTTASCAAGKATGKKGKKAKKAKVKSQTIPAGIKVVAGTKVGFKLG